MKKIQPNTETVDRPFDRLDMAILRVLRDNSRRTLNEIGVEVGLSATACWTRIKRLETEGVIKRYTIDMDRAKLGFRDSVIVQVTLESHSDETLYEFGRTLSAISRGGRGVPRLGRLRLLHPHRGSRHARLRAAASRKALQDSGDTP